MSALLDTSVLVAAERGTFEMPGCRASLADAPVALAAITASELLHGVERALVRAPRARLLRATTVVVALASIGAARCTDRGLFRSRVAVGTQWLQVAVGTYGSCALDSAGEAYCWGADFGREPGGTAFSWTPRPIPSSLRFSSVSVGGTSACGLVAEGAGYCWGSAIESSLGDGITRSSSTPVRVSIPGSVTQISVGAVRACGLDAAGVIFCWGAGLAAFRVTADSFFVSRPSPVRAHVRFRQVSVGTTQVCAIDVADDAYCWGYGYGSTGLGARDTSCATRMGCIDAMQPELVVGDQKWSQVSAGNGFTCGVTRDQRGFCWGDVSRVGDVYGPSGTLGSGALRGSAAPVAVAGGHSFVAVHAGTRHACGLTTDGTAMCWGINRSGELGIGRIDAGVYRSDGRGRYPTPQHVEGGRRFRSVSVGEISCGVALASELLCWGDNSRGMLGTGRGSAHASVPMRIAEPDR